MRRRREVLAAVGSTLVAGLAGCNEGDGGGTGPEEFDDGEETAETIGGTEDDGDGTQTGGDDGDGSGSGGSDDGGDGSGDGGDDEGDVETPDYGDDRFPEGIESDSLAERGNETHLEGVETREHRDPTHISPSADLEYEEHPPTGGKHYPDIVSPGVYDEPQPLAELVHNLEHGHVVIYYDPDAITPEARESLERFAENHDDFWAAVVVVPNPRDEPRAPYFLTAWGKRLAMDEYDARVVFSFLSEYLGRGPENPVRRVERE